MPSAYLSIPSATYRFQFHQGFTFKHATEISDYLHQLGISHVYSSPIFQAGESSTHGYDIADHSRLNPDVGSEDDYSAFIHSLHARQMGVILDFVPNHMGISGALNRWWIDVLENGPQSTYARFFDIDWHPLRPELENRVLLAILNDRYGRVLERGEFKLELDNGSFSLAWMDHVFPLRPRSYSIILDHAAERLPDSTPDDFRDELASIASAFKQLPAVSPGRPEALGVRVREKEVSKRRLARLTLESPDVANAISESLRAIEGTTGIPESFDILDDLIRCQSYRLSYWRVASEEINYRRFFDINTLAAIRIELPEVFQAAHQRVFQMIERGEVNGLRIDHIDGLWNPRSYLEQLQLKFTPQRESGRQLGIYLVVEKILNDFERLPSEWPVHGTTGYEFTNELTALLVDQAAEHSISETYHRFSDHKPFDEVVYEKKLLITQMALASEIAVLGRKLDRLSEKERHYRDFTLSQLTSAVRETIACFPVYRTYVEPEYPVRPDDRRIIQSAIRKARRLNPAIDRAPFDLLAKVLCLDDIDKLPVEERDAWIEFSHKFQQCTGPVMAKGLEDTAFYVYNRFVALNEVGGEPERFGMSTADFHQRCSQRLASHPHSLLASSTHDTKRSEDVRARLVALSEFPHEWRRVCLRFHSDNSKFRTEVDGSPAPSPNEEYLLYQTLLGAWPLEGIHDHNRASFVERIQQYMLKAVKEAKVNSSWIEPNTDWEVAVSNFIDAILDPAKSKRFLRAFQLLVDQLAPVGAVNSLTQVVLKCATPGVPDFYQGSELWDFSLVDPDNRRPVDYSIRRAFLETLPTARPEDLLTDWKSGRIKMFVTQRLLILRNKFPELFKSGSYSPLEATGPDSQHVIAFHRKSQDGELVVVAPRLVSQKLAPPLLVKLNEASFPLDGSWQDLFTGRIHDARGTIDAGAILADFPVACLVRSEK